jgi:hypothetical protein
MACSVEELCARFSSRALTKWWHFYQVEPWGWEVANRRFGTLASLACPKAAEELAGPANWFTDELPAVALYDAE